MLSRLISPSQRLASQSFYVSKSVLKTPLKLTLFENSKGYVKLNFTTSARNGAKRKAARFYQGTQSRVGPAAISVGQMSVAGASMVGLGALCYYGLGLSNASGAIDEAVVWPKYVKERIRDTYMYFGGSLIATAGAAMAAARSPTIMAVMSRNGIMVMLMSIGAMIASSAVCRSIEYTPGFGAKQLAWLVHTGVVGAVIAPLTMLGGPLLIRAAWYTAGVVGGLSTVAVCAPSDKFLNMGGVLAAGLGTVFVASVGSAFFPPTGALGMSLYSISIYGGLILFSGFLLYNTQRVVHKAKNHPYNAIQRYDPINAQMGLYMDAVNIFIRIAMIMAGNRRK